MPRTLFLVPCHAQPRAALTCVWTATGNLRQPLIRTWVERKAGAADADTHESNPKLRQWLAGA